MSQTPSLPSISPLPVWGQAAAPDARREAIAALPLRAASNEEWLPFTIEVVSNAEAMQAAVQVRQAAYARHLPAFSATLSQPEPADLEPGVAVLLARSKLDGSPLGSMRIQTNALRPLPMEASVELPAFLRDAQLAEATRLGVTQAGVGRLVKTALFKAFYLHCIAQEIDHMVVTARSPIDRQYERLLFKDVFPGRGPIPFRHVGNLPHRVLSFDMLQAERAWQEANHPLLDFMCHTHHPDIHVAPAVAPRARGLRTRLGSDSGLAPSRLI